MATFENPANGYREEVSSIAGVWAFLFGIFYFLVKGVWKHAAIQFVLIIFSFVLLGVGGIAVMFLVWIGYAIAAPGILRARYLRMGWREVDYDVPSSDHTSATSPPHHDELPKAVDTRECPRCAETIKKAAVVCRFCGAELAPEAGVNPPQTPIGVAGETLSEGNVVRHAQFGVGFVVRETDPGKVLVRFDGGHQVVHAAELQDLAPARK